MNLADIPAKFAITWASSAAGGTIRTPPENPTGQAGAASFSTGFGALNFVQVASGGVPPFGQDVNGILALITEWGQWAQAGGAQPFDGTFATEIGGYPKSAILPAATQAGVWYNLADGNSGNPDTGAPNWVLIGPGMEIGALGGDISGTIADAVINAGAVTGTKIANATVANVNLANMTGPAVKGRLSGTGAPQDLALIPSSPGNYILTPLADGRTFVDMWGSNGAVADGSITPITFPITITTIEGFILGTGNSGGSTNNAMAQEVTGTLTGAGVSVKMQNFAASGGPAQTFRWRAWGYL
jgi:hypothetical protein